jgi:hypothetical protein
MNIIYFRLWDAFLQTIKLTGVVAGNGAKYLSKLCGIEFVEFSNAICSLRCLCTKFNEVLLPCFVLIDSM